MLLPTIELPTLPLKGGCQCGAVRYEMGGVPHVFYFCHCRECQRQTSSAFGQSLRVRRSDLTIEGSLKSVFRSSASGRRREGRFCPDCGVRIVHCSAGSDMVNIKAGTLDETAWLVPAGHIWLSSAQRFFAPHGDALCYERQPDDDYDALAQRWRSMIARS